MSLDWTSPSSRKARNGGPGAYQRYDYKLFWTFASEFFPSRLTFSLDIKEEALSSLVQNHTVGC